MRQIWITRAGPPEVLQVREAADPAPNAGEDHIRVEASGVNFADIMGRMVYIPICRPFRLCLATKSAVESTSPLASTRAGSAKT